MLIEQGWRQPLKLSVYHPQPEHSFIQVEVRVSRLGSEKKLTVEIPWAVWNNFRLFREFWRSGEIPRK